MRCRVFVTGSGIALEARELLERHGCLVQNGDPKDTPEVIAQKVKVFGPEALIVRQGRITEQVLDAAGSLKVISKHGVGTDNIDLEAATRRGIPVFITPRANFEAAAEHSFALMLALVRRVAAEDRKVQKGIFDKAKYDGIELSGKTLGLVGFGKIARRLAELVAPFRMRVLAYHPSSTPEALLPHVTKMGGLSELLAEADIISLHCPLNPQSRWMINAQSISRMKRGVHIVNTARGGLIHEPDLMRALADGSVRGAALDVLEIEPPAAENPLLGLDNVILTPHVAGISDQSSRNMGVQAVRNALSILHGQAIDREALVNTAVLASAETAFSRCGALLNEPGVPDRQPESAFQKSGIRSL
jgi:D-3-phosphoglycerate dehydrogenase / 2-oxoglutarate reductase